MRLRLLAPHIVVVGPNNDCWRPAGTVIEMSSSYRATPLMEGLDDEGRAAVAYAKLAAWGRYPWPYGLYPPSGPPLDDPPIPRPLDDNQPVFRYTGAPEYL